MAGGAIGTESTVVFVILFMAGETICRCAFVNIIDMALLALRFRMSTFQFEDRKIVIELRGFPAVGGMTSCAI